MSSVRERKKRGKWECGDDCQVVRDGGSDGVIVNGIERGVWKKE